MTLRVLGLSVWTVVHVFLRVAPDAHAALGRAIGSGPARGVAAVLLLVATVLMVVGFRGAPVVAVYDPPAWGIHLNNLLMICAVFLLGAGHSKGVARRWLRHPMLTAVAIWAVAHLLVNGDRASLVLFGWLGLWAIAEMLLINAREPVWVRPEPGTKAGTVRWVVISVVVFAVITAVHTWLGYWPFPQ
jgi:uncharacterized membrane protein